MRMREKYGCTAEDKEGCYPNPNIGDCKKCPYWGIVASNRITRFFHRMNDWDKRTDKKLLDWKAKSKTNCLIEASCETGAGLIIYLSVQPYLPFLDKDDLTFNVFFSIFVLFPIFTYFYYLRNRKQVKKIKNELGW
jgi:hypothetical protein